MAAVIFEIAVAGRPLPILLAISGRPSGYLYYGLPSLHGFLLAFGSALILIDQAARLSAGRVVFGPRSAAYFVWLLAVLGRKQMIVAVIQIAVLILASGKVRVSLKQISRGFALALVVVFGFGLLGGVRSVGSDSISMKLRYTGPSFLPESFVWVYAYLTTPVANLASAVAEGFAGHSLSPLTNFYTLLPSVVTGRGSDHTYSDSAPWLLTKNFNVSTGYIDALRGGGWPQIALYAVFIGLIIGILRNKYLSVGCVLAHVAAYQCAFAMMYANNFVNLNNVSQIPFLLLLAARCVILENEPRKMSTNSTSQTGIR